MKNKTSNQEPLQQGDVLLNPIGKDFFSKADWEKAKRQPLNGRFLTLAYGERTGHHHSITLEVGEETDNELIAIGDTMILNLAKEQTVTHQEHGDIKIAPGLYEVAGLQEFDWTTQMTRKVVD